MIKLLIFDAGDLIWIRTKWNLEREMNKFFKKYKIDGIVVSSRWEEIKDKVEVGKIKYNKAIEIQFKGLDVNKKVIKKWFDFHMKEVMFGWKLRPQAKPTLKKLKKSYKLAVLTDDVKNKKYKMMMYKKFNVEVFNETFSSHDIGFRKPQREAYYTVLRRFRVKPSETIFVGHSKDEIEGARKFKIRTIAIDWDKGTKSDFYANKFSDIPKILEKIK